MKTSSQDSNPRPVNKGRKVKQGRKVHQGIRPIKEDRFDKEKEALQDELQGFMYSQSSKLSSVSRNLIFGILGTIWVMTFAGGKLTIPNPQLFYALLTSLLFMATDILHYLLDSISYHRQQYKLELYKTKEEIANIYNTEMDGINKRSHKFVIGKTVILFIASIMFIWGIMDFIPSICELVCTNKTPSTI